MRCDHSSQVCAARSARTLIPTMRPGSSQGERAGVASGWLEPGRLSKHSPGASQTHPLTNADAVAGYARQIKNWLDGRAGTASPAEPQKYRAAGISGRRRLQAVEL